MVRNKPQNLKIEMVPISKLKPANYNPRKISASAMEQLKESIRRFSMIDPIVVNGASNRMNVVIGGHQRLRAAKELGHKEIPVVYVRINNIKKEKELNLRLNTNAGEWDYDLLKGFDVDLLLDVGFSDQELSNIWDDQLEAEDDNFDVEKELANIKKPKTKPGDMFQLGMHRLICGDATNPSVVKELVGKSLVDMVYSDPPFNISLSYDKGIGNKVGKYGGTHTNDNRTDFEYRKFLKATMENGLAVSKKDLHMFYFSDETYIGMIQSLFSELGLQNRRVCIWVKNNQNPTPQIAFNKVYEPVTYATRGNPYLAKNVTSFNEILNKEVGTGNRVHDDILDLFNIWLAKRKAGQDYTHPTEKPPTLHEKALRRCTKPGDLILDLFGGSGSTLIASEQLKRKCFLVEFEPIFCDLIIKRYENLTKQNAKKIN